MTENKDGVVKSYCPRCGGLVVKGIHYKTATKDTPDWTDKELEMLSHIPCSTIIEEGHTA